MTLSDCEGGHFFEVYTVIEVVHHIIMIHNAIDYGGIAWVTFTLIPFDLLLNSMLIYHFSKK